MSGEERRSQLLTALTQSHTPISASALADRFGVSRQVIVQDVALLRANGTDILATHRGYVLTEPEGITRVFKVVHADDDVKKELFLYVDAGAVVKDVFISHKVYGTIRAEMNIRSRQDVLRFLEQISTGSSALLKNVTSGYHYHTITAPDKKTLDLIESQLKEEGFLAPLQDYEPEELDLS